MKGMTNDEYGMTNGVAPSARDYRVTITGPQGVCLDMVMDAELRLVRLFAIDDAKLRELLIVTSVAAGQVEAENDKAAKLRAMESLRPIHATPISDQVAKARDLVFRSTTPTCAVNEEGKHD